MDKEKVTRIAMPIEAVNFRVFALPDFINKTFNPAEMSEKRELINILH
ncbi:MAG: hypothetical protein HQL27_05280 [Candidatus Omnitrophica bacterium]|nr:hypothetical protein [Candidatus Omnitrophota bacterium]